MSETLKKETSQRRKDASRANGAKSKGPVTPAGKARSSQNAVTHGFLRVNVRTEEEQATVDHMTQGYLARFQPRDLTEYQLVLRAVVATFNYFQCQNRAVTIINTQMAKDSHTVEAEWRNATDEDREALAFMAAEKGLDRAERYGRGFASQADRALKTLTELRKQPLLPPGGPMPVDPPAAPPAILRNEPSPTNGHPGVHTETESETVAEVAEIIETEQPETPRVIARDVARLLSVPMLRQAEYAQPEPPEPLFMTASGSGGCFSDGFLP